MKTSIYLGSLLSLVFIQNLSAVIPPDRSQYSTPVYVDSPGYSNGSNFQSSNEPYYPPQYSQKPSSFNQNTSTFSNENPTLNAKIQQVIAKDAAGQNVQFTFNNGKVTLTGTVSNENDKKRIESTIKQISEVFSVDNKLTVQSER